MSNSLWKIKNQTVSATKELLAAGYSPLLAAILSVRGYDSRDKADAFIKCGPSLLEDPFLMTDMREAATRIKAALEKDEKIVVFGDYDVDGITSACLVASYLKSKGAKTEIYIPSRLEEGYGINSDAIRRFAAQGVSLVITVDCGITAIDEAQVALENGIDLIITDHHECREILPKAVAVINPKRPDCAYQNRDLAGVGVAFKLLCALEGGYEEILALYSDLVAVGTIADVMPLTGENRFIVQTGLSKLCSCPRPGLSALITASWLSPNRISAVNIGFTIAPRINAAGRLGSTECAVNLLMTEDPAKAELYAADLCALNRRRQELETKISGDAAEKLSGRQADAPIVLASEGWHQGVVGISASKLAEAHNVPAIMICLDGELGKGSCRSYGGFNLFDALSACSHMLEGYGGHALAAGLTIKRENIDAFRDAFCDFYANNPPSVEPSLDIDLLVTSSDMLSMHSVKDLELLEPCGSSNTRALLSLSAVTVLEVASIGGGKHLKLKFSAFGQVYDAVYFSKTLKEANVSQGDCVDVAFSPQINEFRSRQSVQLLVIDLRQHEADFAQQVLEGGEIPSYLSSPTREDFATIWRSAKCFGGQLKGTIQQVFRDISPDMQEETLAVCLKVFEELDLLSLSFDGKNLDLKLSKDSKKVDLSSSRILSSLS